MSKTADAFRTISEVADDLGIPKHVLRFWEVKFPQIKPMKRGGGRRYYRPTDLELLRGIRHLLHREGYTIKGVQKILREQGVETVKQMSGSPTQTSAATAEPKSERPTGSPAQTRRQGKVSKKLEASPPADAVDISERQRIIRQAIVELEACRSLLKGERAKGEAATAAEHRRSGSSR